MAGINSNTALCLHFNGVDGTTTFIDSSPLANTITPSGDAQLDTAEKKFGSASGLFDGTGDYLTTPAFTTIHFGSNDFTIDTWAYLNEDMGTSRFITGLGGGVSSWSDPAGMEWNLQINADSHIYFTCRQSSTYYSMGSTGTISIASAWHHFAVIRNGTTITIYVDGTSVGSDTITGEIETVSGGTPLLVIGSDGRFADPWKGWLDEFRIQSGEAYRTADFTPPTEEYRRDYFSNKVNSIRYSGKICGLAHTKIGKINAV